MFCRGAAGLARSFVSADVARGAAVIDVPRGGVQAGNDSVDGGTAAAGSAVVGDDSGSATVRR